MMNLEELKAKWREEEEFERGGIARTIRFILADLDALEPSDEELIYWGFQGTKDVYMIQVIGDHRFELCYEEGDKSIQWNLWDGVPTEARAILLEAWRKEQGNGD